MRTKINAQGASGGLLVRSHLIERLNESTNRKLTLISTPVGFGKTTLVVQWLADWDAAIQATKESE